MHFETMAIHAGAEPDETTGAISPPIHLSTTFERDETGQPTHQFGYIRESNPTQSRLEEALAMIEGGAAALSFGSGQAAGAAVIQSLPANSHIVLARDSYHGFIVLSQHYLAKWGVDYTVVDSTNLEEVSGAVRANTAVIWVETPSNPQLSIVDIRAVAAIAHSAGARLVVDSTFATPALQQPLSLGADIALHSTTKYLGGHSDVQGGSLAFAARDEFMEGVAHARKYLGAVSSPFNSWLVLRGIRTLAARMRVHSANAQAVAEFLESHQRVVAVHYPGLTSHPAHQTAKAQMSGFGGMLSFRIDGSGADALKTVSRAKLFTRATSLGGVESLIEHRRTSEGEASNTPENLIRVSIGLEHHQDLIDDLTQSLS